MVLLLQIAKYLTRAALIVQKTDAQHQMLMSQLNHTGWMFY